MDMKAIEQVSRDCKARLDAEDRAIRERRSSVHRKVTTDLSGNVIDVVEEEKPVLSQPEFIRVMK